MKNIRKKRDRKKIIIEKNIKIQELMCGTYFTIEYIIITKK